MTGPDPPGLAIHDDSGIVCLMSDEMERWRRLGPLLKRRRVELGFPVRIAFARHHRQPQDRIMSDLEQARRSNYDELTLHRAEGWYQLAEGSITRFLDGAVDALEPAAVPHLDAMVGVDLEGAVALVEIAASTARRDMEREDTDGAWEALTAMFVLLEKVFHETDDDGERGA